MSDFEVRSVEYHRDTSGTLIEASAWRTEFLAPPAPARADVRIVRLRVAPNLASRPGWLMIETTVGGVADIEAPYIVDRAPTAASTIERQLWQASPHWRPQRPILRGYLDAALAALLSPETPPEGLLRSEAAALAELRSFALARREREPWSTLASADEPEAIERWVQLSFEEPDALADTVLLERLDADGEMEAARLLRYLRGARIVEDTPERVELAVDLRALLEQATPWRHYERDDLAAAWPAVRAWARRYRVAYERWYRHALEDLEVTRTMLAAADPQLTMLSRLDSVEALGAPDGEGATANLARILAAIDALPSTVGEEEPTSGDLALGGRFELVADAEAALAGLEVTVDRRQRRLASALTSLVMGRTDVDPLDRVLQALLASDLDDLDRVLSSEVLAQIERLLGGGNTVAGPVSQLLTRYDEVSQSTIDEIVVSFRILLEDAVEDGEPVGLR